VALVTFQPPLGTLTARGPGPRLSDR